MTLNATVANWPPTSVAITDVPEVPLGTVKEQLNDPVPLVVREPFVQPVIGTLSRTSPTVLDTEKPVPETVTVLPTGPFTELTPIQGFVTLKVAAAA